MQISSSDWLDLIRREYLEDFVREGGSAVKFLVPASGLDGSGLRDGFREIAQASGFQYTFVDSKSTKIHLIDRLFHEVARQVDWDGLTHVFLSRVLAEKGLRIPATQGEFSLGAIARLNDYAESPLRIDVHQSIWKKLFHDYGMSQEFRLAMIQLCRSQLDPSDDPALGTAVKEWLRGELRLLSAVKRALIFQRIARHNARHMLFSLAHWLKLTGMSGLVLGLDIERYADSARPSERGDGFYYSTAAALDTYEVLRQLIDGTDELEFCLVGVFAGPEFLTDPRRGIESYRALYFRIFNEVRDKYIPNPLAALVRLAATG